MNLVSRLILLIILVIPKQSHSQEVEINNYSINNNGQVQLEISASSDRYYILNVKNKLDQDHTHSTSLTLGKPGLIIITEPLSSLPIEHYQILEFLISQPADNDNDGIDDLTENEDLPTQGPLNTASPIGFINGTVSVNSLTTFKGLSLADTIVPWSPFLNDKQFVKFAIVDLDTDIPQLYFINSETHYLHRKFMEAVAPHWIDDPSLIKGEITYNPTVVSNNGTLGDFSFNYSVGAGRPFETVQKCHELIAANMPFLKNNLSYFVPVVSQSDYEDDKELFDESRVPILLEEDVYADIDYLALNVSEGFGFFRQMTLDETPNSRDVVLYDAVPNALPRVGGILTSFVQTPLSHVNLRAIQDNLPNAYIRDPLAIDTIASLIGKYIYYKVAQNKYFIREATLEEVNLWFDDIRPTQEQTPKLNLNYKTILPLDEIGFDMADGFGAKCANVATMRTFGFSDQIIPDGFGIPFYYYQEFMKYNGFFEDVDYMINNPEFQSDLNKRLEVLENFRDEIRDADMPQWMLDNLGDMQSLFPEGTSIRCRSSTNNEDLPGFSGAGLYTSKTQHPDEGHISKSIKQVYASMWNFRAFDERDFYRVNQYIASMGILCHPNYPDEKANGVGVSTDPIYQTEDTYYLNTQVGENLVTNPDAFSAPEEILLDRYSVTEDDYIVLRYSSLLDDEELVMDDKHLDKMRDYLTVIHDEFQKLYKAEESEDFAMDIEYKITYDDQLIIKQARPWATFWSNIGLSVDNPPIDNLSFYPNPTEDYLNINCDCGATNIVVFNLSGEPIANHRVKLSIAVDQISTRRLSTGMYIIAGFDDYGKLFFSKKIFKK
ncbi:MAG: hypothetical protein ACI86M_000980 [Saprospiraceae bacterium]|jgi:hypothetical protein